MKSFLVGIAALGSSILLLTSCNSSQDKSQNSSETSAINQTQNSTVTTLKNDTLTSFLLGGIYFFQGFGGADKTFANVHREMSKEPNAPGFDKELETVYEKMMIYPYHKSVKDKEESIKALGEWWEIHDAHEFHELLDQLLSKGHEAIYEDLKKVLDENGGANAVVENIPLDKFHLESDATILLQFIKTHYNEFDKKSGIKAWDLVRYAQVVCLGYSAEYITMNEGYSYLEKALRVARNVYPDWSTYYKGFILGRRFWGADTANTSSLEKLSIDMQKGDYSIYKYLPLK